MPREAALAGSAWLQPARCVALWLSVLAADLVALKLPWEMLQLCLCLQPVWLWQHSGAVPRRAVQAAWQERRRARADESLAGERQSLRLGLAMERSQHALSHPAATAKGARKKSKGALRRRTPPTAAAAAAGAGPSAATPATGAGQTAAPAAAPAAPAASTTAASRPDPAMREALGQRTADLLAQSGAGVERLVTGRQADASTGVGLDSLLASERPDAESGRWAWSWVAAAARSASLRREWCACLAAEVVAQRCRNAASLSLRTYGPRALRDLSRVPGGLDEWYALVDPAMAAASIHDWGVVAARQEARKRREAERRAISKFLAPRRDEAATAEAGDAAASAAAEAEAAPEGEARPDGHEAASGGAAGEWPGGLQQVAAAEAVAAAGSLGGGEDASDPGGRRADEPSASEGSDGDATPSPSVALFAAFRRWLWLLAGAEIEARERGGHPHDTPPPPPPSFGIPGAHPAAKPKEAAFKAPAASRVVPRGRPSARSGPQTSRGPAAHRPGVGVASKSGARSGAAATARGQASASAGSSRSRSRTRGLSRSAARGGARPRAAAAATSAPNAAVWRPVPQPRAWADELRTPSASPSFGLSVRSAGAASLATDSARGEPPAAAVSPQVRDAERLRQRRAARARAEAAAQQRAAAETARRRGALARRVAAATRIQALARGRAGRKYAQAVARWLRTRAPPLPLDSANGIGAGALPVLFGVRRAACVPLALATMVSAFPAITALNLRGSCGGEGPASDCDSKSAAYDSWDGCEPAAGIDDIAWIGHIVASEEAPEPKAGKAIIETPPGPPALLRSASPAEMILNHIPQMAAVTALDLSFASGCGDAEFAALAALPRLASLEVNGWQALSAEGIVKFVANSRRSTILPAQQPLLSKRDASHGAAARSLVGQAALRAPPLRSLSLGDCRRIDDAALFAIGRGLQGVEDLCLFGCSMVTDHAAASFSGSSSRLRRLCVAGAYKFGRDATRFLLTSVNPHMIVYVNPAEFSRCAFDQGPSTEEAFPAGEAPGGSCDPEEPLEESLLRPATPARSTYSRPRVTSTLPAVEPRRCSCRNTDD